MPAGIPFGEYRLIRRLGAGGMAEVFLAKRVGPQGFEKQLVIKRILPHLTESPVFVQMFLDEARLAARVDHPNLVHVSGFGQIDGSYYLAMEYVDGITLADLLKLCGALTPGVAGRIAMDLLAALHAIHTAPGPDGQPLRLVHRDVSARNVMLTRDGAAKLLDFGIAVQSEQASGKAIGTRRYMSPEQVRGDPLDPRSDLFSVGILVYELIMGAPPEQPDRPEAIPPELWLMLTRALEAEPGQRPASAQKMQAELELFVAARGREGTRTHLTELLASLALPGSPVARAFSRLTRITNVLGSQSSSGSQTAPPPRRGPGAYLAAIALIILSTAVITVVWPRGENAKARPPSVAIDKPALPPAPVPTESSTGADVALPSSVHQAEPLAGDAPIPRRTPRRVEHSEPAFGRLTIDTQPWSEVYLGDRKLGVTPMEGLRMPAGSHELVLKNPELGRETHLRVMIRPGKTARVRRDW